jgi:hypothetical protein
LSLGVADANAARNNIAKDYMKKCNCIWILAPITRAVDDKTARGIPIISLIIFYFVSNCLFSLDLLGDAFKMQLMSKSSTAIYSINSESLHHSGCVVNFLHTDWVSWWTIIYRWKVRIWAIALKSVVDQAFSYDDHCITFVGGWNETLFERTLNFPDSEQV